MRQTERLEQAAKEAELAKQTSIDLQTQVSYSFRATCVPSGGGWAVGEGG